MTNAAVACTIGWRHRLLWYRDLPFCRLEVLTTLAMSRDEVTQEHAVEALSEILTIPSIQVCWGPLWDTISSIQVCWGPLLDTISSVQVLRPSQIYSLSLSYRYVGVPSEIIIIPSIQVCWGLLLHGHHLFQVCWGPLLHQGQIWCRLKKKEGPVGETINWGPPFLYTCKKITCLH